MRCRRLLREQIPPLEILIGANNSSRTGFDRGLGKHFITFVSDQNRLVDFTKVRLGLFPSTPTGSKSGRGGSSNHPVELICNARVLPDGDSAHQTRHPLPVPPTLRRDEIHPAADDVRHDRHRVVVGARLLLHKLVPRLPGVGRVGLQQHVRRQVRVWELGPEQRGGGLPRADVDEHGPRPNRLGHPSVVLSAAKTELEVSGQSDGVVFSWLSVSPQNRSHANRVAFLHHLI